jgi:hypothetical protein
MSQNTTNALATLRKLREQFAAGRPDSGQRYFPDKGNHKAIVNSVTIAEGTTKVGNNEVPATTVAFNFTQLADTTTDGKNRDFTGKTFYLPADPSAYVPQGGKKATRFTIDRDRLLGHIDVILDSGGSPPPIDQALEAVISKLAGGAVVVELYADHNPYKDGKGNDRIEHVEKLQRLLSA